MIKIDIQMPEKCGLCPCFHSDNPMYCQAVKADKIKKIVAPYGAPRPEWCPLKEQEEQKRKWLQNIADNQLSIGGVDPLTEYEQGKWDGLQMAFEILTEERQH